MAEWGYLFSHVDKKNISVAVNTEEAKSQKV